MFNHKHTDICVIGAGPVGLVAAHALADAKVDFVQFDTAAGPHTHSYALALLPETLELLDRIGLAEHILPRAHKVSRMAFYQNNQRKGEFDYGQLDSPYPFLAVIQQGELEGILLDTLKAKGHKPHWHHRVRYINEEEDHVSVEVDRLIEGMTGYAYAHIDTQIDKILAYRANYVIGADGSRSIARRVAGIGYNEMAAAKTYAVFEFKTDQDMLDEMRLIVDEYGSHFFWPMAGEYCRWCFEIYPDEVLMEKLQGERSMVFTGKEAFPLLDDAHLAGFLSRHAQWFKGGVDAMSWRTLVRFEERMVESFGRGRIWLAGDAAHLTGPGGMLSMNVGMLEADDLAQRLALGADDARQAALATYSDERQQEWSELLDLSAAWPEDCADPWLMEHSKRVALNLPATRTSRAALLRQFQLEPA